MYPAKDASTKYVIKCFRDMIKTCGAPNRIIFEQGAVFTSRQFSDFAVEIGTTHHVCFRHGFIKQKLPESFIRYIIFIDYVSNE
jgi:hypothetical protein